MTSLLLLAVFIQGAIRPATLPPSAELGDKSSIIGDVAGLVFDPELGGLLMSLNRDWDLSLSRASDAGLMVNLRTGELNYVAAPDLLNRQIVCPSAVFVRCYRSELAKLGKHSPGLTDGWVDNYDLIVKLPDDKEKWQPVILTYPNKAQELIEPELDDQGKPTGKGRSLSNATYDVTLVPGDTVNSYSSIAVAWPNSGVKWMFEPHASGVMVLRTITSGQAPGGTVRLSYFPDRTLATVTDIGRGAVLMNLTYSGGLLATTDIQSDYIVGYTYTQLNGNTVLWKVSQPFRPGTDPKDGFAFSYATEISYPALAQIAIPKDGGWSRSRIEYADGRITAVQGASGVRQLVGGSGGK